MRNIQEHILLCSLIALAKIKEIKETSLPTYGNMNQDTIRSSSEVVCVKKKSWVFINYAKDNDEKKYKRKHICSNCLKCKLWKNGNKRIHV